MFRMQFSVFLFFLLIIVCKFVLPDNRILSGNEADALSVLR